MSNSPLRPGRRRALVAGTVAGLAVASVAGSLVTGASAAPKRSSSAAPAPSPADPAAAPSGLRARTMDGAERAVPRSTTPLAQRLGGAGATSADAAATTEAVAAAAAPAVKAPAYVPIGTTGIVASGSQSLAFAPDGSRVAWVSGYVAYSARPNGSGTFHVNKTGGAKRIAWSPNGRFLTNEYVPTTSFRVITAATRQTLVPVKSRDPIVPTSWLTSNTVVALLPKRDTFVLAPVFDGSFREYRRGSATVLDAIGSPDGTKVAVRVRTSVSNTGTEFRESIVVVDAATLTDIATVISTLGQLGRPAWGPDSGTVYVPRTEGGTTSIVAHAANTADGDPTVVLADATATPRIYLRPRASAPGFGERYGSGAVAASVAVSKEAFTRTRGTSCSQPGAAVSAVIAKAGSVEATVAAPLAAHTCGPLLLTGSRSLDKRVAVELRRLLRPGRAVRLVGNTTSLSPAVATAVTRLGFKPVRYAGRDVYATSVQVALKGFKDHGTAALASASQPMAAVVAASTAGSSDVPLLLTAGTRMPAVTNAFLTRYRTGAWVVGSQAVKAAPWAYRYSSTNDVATALTTASRFYYPPRWVTLVSPNAVADAYAGAGFAALYGSAVLVVGPKALPSTVRTYIDQASASVEGASLFAPTRAVVSKVLTDAVKLGGGQTLQ